MSRSVGVALILIILILAGGFFAYSYLIKASQKSKPAPQVQFDGLTLLKTDPDPLDEATILPTQSIIITFNKIIPKSEFKFKFDPEIKDIEVEAQGGKIPTEGSIMKINFKKPLQLGGGYSLSITNSTRTNDGQKLDREYNYHFKTIGYNGV